MCGICGIWGHSDPAKTDRMVAAMHHRGPDDSGVYNAANISLGMTRLAVIDLNPTGHQPMSNSEQTLWIIFNGEIYNYREERVQLEKLGYKFVSTSDTEVILRMYEQYGDDFLLRLRGMFALAIYDKRKGTGSERLFIARDQLGIKPLLYSERGGTLLFASELKALLASGSISSEIDPVALRLLLTYGSVYQPRTMLKDVKALLPAHRMIIENGQNRIERYWSLGTDRYPELRNAPYEEQVRVVNEAVAESLKLQLVSDVPLGAFLSGGVDSSILVALMALQVGNRVKTFSVGFDSEGAAFDESHDAAQTAKYLGTDHTHVLVTGRDVRERIFHIACSLDQPTVDGVNSYFISWAARKGVTVAISGTGGDEMFAGYPWFQNMEADSLQPRSWRARISAQLARQNIFDPVLAGPRGVELYQTRTQAGFLSRYSMQYQIFGSLGAARLLETDIRASAQAGRAEHFDLQAIDELSSAGVVERVSALCLRGYTGNQLLRDIDAASMAHSLEVRVPYLDPVIADITLSLPFKSKSGGGDMSNPALVNTYRYTGAKKILIDAGRSLLPPDFDIQPKRGFAMPFDAWLKGPLSAVLSDSLSEASVRKRGWFNPVEVHKIQENFKSSIVGWAHPWLLMMTELWAREVLDKNNELYF
jgi:asparagine synthase (glutamine-hydrolysing)